VEKTGTESEEGPRINADERGSEKRNAVESSRKVNENGSGRYKAD
jgi:hypothetical protein